MPTSLPEHMLRYPDRPEHVRDLDTVAEHLRVVLQGAELQVVQLPSGHTLHRHGCAHRPRFAIVREVDELVEHSSGLHQLARHALTARAGGPTRVCRCARQRVDDIQPSALEYVWAHHDAQQLRRRERAQADAQREAERAAAAARAREQLHEWATELGVDVDTLASTARAAAR